MFPGSFMHKLADFRPGRGSGLELRVNLTGPELVGGLVGRPTPDYAPVEPSVFPIVRSITPHLQHLDRKRAFEVPIGGELVILAIGDLEQRGAHAISFQ
jgi:hypothetical protein